MKPSASIPSPKPGRFARFDRAWDADWLRFLFVHYSVPTDALASHVPFRLAQVGGRAFVSLVFFTLERMRPGRTGWLGTLLARPISEHPFLNVRTYVEDEAGPGICFLAEWVPNRISEFLGPRTYGLPYRRGIFEQVANADTGIIRLSVRDHALGAALELAWPIVGPDPAPCASGSADEFLLERYRAYTFRGRSRRWFSVSHRPWRAAPVTWIRTQTDLITAAFPWFASATFHSAHVSPGVEDVAMGFPHQLSDRRVRPEVGALPRTIPIPVPAP